MKTLKETLNEGWAGQEGIEAYNEMLEAFNLMEKETILDTIFDYFSQRDLKGYYGHLVHEGYIY